jgi:succinate dehydrogenase / fumarate reductase, cytochrome b subunit
MKPNRPVFLDLWRIKLPAMGLVSILHRVSGVLLVLCIPGAAYLFHQSLSGPEGFAATAATLADWPVRLFLLILGWSFLHHLFAGIRHLVLDLGIGLEREVARASARAVMVAALAVLAIGGGMLL